MPYKLTTPKGTAIVNLVLWQAASDLHDIMDELSTRGEKDAKKALADLWDMAVVKQTLTKTRNDPAQKQRNGIFLPILDYINITLKDEEQKLYAPFFSEKYQKTFESVISVWPKIDHAAKNLGIDASGGTWFHAYLFASQVKNAELKKISGSDFIDQEVFAIFDEKNGIFWGKDTWTSLLHCAQIFSSIAAAEKIFSTHQTYKTPQTLIIPLSLSVAPSQAPTENDILKEARTLASRNELLKETLKGSTPEYLAKRAAGPKKM